MLPKRACMRVYIYIYVCVSVCLSVCPSVRLSVCLSVYMSECLYVCLYVCMSQHFRHLIWVKRCAGAARPGVQQNVPSGRLRCALAPESEGGEHRPRGSPE